MKTKILTKLTKKISPVVVQPGPTHDQISDRAKALWEQKGRPENKDLEIWLEAEAQLRTEFSSQQAIR
jgi:hypothetical protein